MNIMYNAIIHFRTVSSPLSAQTGLKSQNYADYTSNPEIIFSEDEYDAVASPADVTLDSPLSTPEATSAPTPTANNRKAGTKGNSIYSYVRLTRII